MRFEKTIYIDRLELDAINKALNVEPESADECLGEDVSITNTIKFDNGYEMDIKCCGVQYEEANESNTAWSEAVLYDDKGLQVSYTEPAEDYEGKWVLEDAAGNEYVAIVERERVIELNDELSVFSDRLDPETLFSMISDYRRDLDLTDDSLQKKIKLATDNVGKNIKNESKESYKNLNRGE